MVQKNQKLYDPKAVEAVQAKGLDVMEYVRLELARRDAWTKYKRLRALYMRAFVYEDEVGVLRFGPDARRAYRAYVSALRAVAEMTGFPATTLQP